MYVPYCKFLLLIFNALNIMLFVIFELRINWLKPFYTSLQPNETMLVILLSYAPKTLAKFVEGKNDKNICEMHDLSFE